jgi:rare lipoprotein A
MSLRRTTPAALRLGLLLICLATGPALAAEEAAAPAAPPPAAGDRSGGAQRGQAAVVASSLTGRRMASGGRFDPTSDSVASNTLPLGTTARVTNLRNGRIALVRVHDRMPERDGRILNVSPRIAAELGMRPDGVARVAVAPLAVPQRDGTVKLGTGTGFQGRRAHITQPSR